jgi:hypothetical protein
MLRLCIPLLASRIACELVVPTGIFPKLTLLGVAVSVCAAVTTPVPLSLYLTQPFVASLPMITYPVTSTACVGAKFTVIVTCAPGEIDSGTVIPLTLYMLARKLSLVICTLTGPVFVITTAIVALLLTFTFPKCADAGLNVSVPWAPRASLAAIPAHTSSAQTSSDRGRRPPPGVRESGRFLWKVLGCLCREKA